MQNMLTGTEDWLLPLSPKNILDCSEMDGNHIANEIRQVHADLDEFEDPLLNGRIDAVGEHSSHVLCSLQNQEMENLPSTSADDIDGKSSSSLYEANCSGESNQHDIENAQMDTVNLENQQNNPPCDSINSAHVGSDYNALVDVEDKNLGRVGGKHERRRKLGISRESIQQCISENMTLQNAAKYLNVHESTIKRRLKEFDITWSGSKRRKRHEIAKNKKHNDTESQCAIDASPITVMDPSNSAQHDHGMLHVAGSTFDVKATYNGETVRVDNFSLRSSIEKLKEEVGKRLELEVDKIKMKYLDTSNEWIRMTAVSDLAHALHSSETSGNRVVRLEINLKT